MEANNEAVQSAVLQMRHPTAEQVVAHLAVRGGPSRATVYRLLAQLADAGRLTVTSRNGINRYDAIVAPHTHLQCAACGSLTDVEVPADLYARFVAMAKGARRGFFRFALICTLPAPVAKRSVRSR